VNVILSFTRLDLDVRHDTEDASVSRSLVQYRNYRAYLVHNEY